MRQRVGRTLLVAGLSLAAVSACGDDGDSGDSGAESPDDLPTAAATTSPFPSASATGAAPTPSRTPAVVLSRFEGDPAVAGLRAYLLAKALAVNAKQPRSPALYRLATARQQKDIPRVLTADRGRFFPGPEPVQPLGVRVSSPTERVISACLIESGWVLTRRGGTAAGPRLVEPGTITMIREDGRWKVDSFARSSSISCAGVDPVEQTW